MAATDADLIAEMEKREKAALDTKQGPDHNAILKAVAEKHGLSVDHLRTIWLNHWDEIARTG